MRTSVLALSALAAPALSAYIPNLDPRQIKNADLLGCDVSGVTINLPEAAAAGNVTVDPAQRIRFLTLGIGFQVRKLAVDTSPSYPDSMACFRRITPAPMAFLQTTRL
jgi:hypothetical protein